jgi:hypothetical protein
MRRQGFAYRVFGLSFHSERELPDLSIDRSPGDDPDVSILWKIDSGGVTSSGVDPVPGGAVLRIEGAGAYDVRHGRSIVVTPIPGAPEPNVRLFLLGSAMGLLLHQRGLLPLHANAVEIDGMAIAFMGPSGIGKSTLAAWFHDRGHRVLADDVCAVSFDAGGSPWVQPGIPRLRLWRNSLEAAGRSAHGLQRSFVGDDAYDKWDFPIRWDGQANPSVQLAAICILSRSGPLAVSPIDGVAAIEELFALTYRGAMLTQAGTASSHWRDCIRLQRAVPIFLANRSWDLAGLGSESDKLLQALQERLSRLNPVATPPNG